MKKKVYYLASCDTCKRIMNEVGVDKSFEQQEIKSEPIRPDQLDEMKELAGSYELLFSRSARKYSELGLDEKQLAESDYRSYILSEYTFLKRPVFIIGKRIFIGNSKTTIEHLKTALATS